VAFARQMAAEQAARRLALEVQAASATGAVTPESPPGKELNRLNRM
jgi:hypothetical protein